MTTISLDFTDFKFDTDHNVIMSPREIVDSWVVDCTDSATLVLEYRGGDRQARKFISASTTPSHQMQYDEFWVLYDPISQTAVARHNSVNNLENSAGNIVSWTATYIAQTDMIQLVAYTTTQPTRLRISTRAIEVG